MTESPISHIYDALAKALGGDLNEAHQNGEDAVATLASQRDAALEELERLRTERDSLQRRVLYLEEMHGGDAVTPDADGLTIPISGHLEKTNNGYDVVPDTACKHCDAGYSTTEHPIFGTPGWHSVAYEDGDYVACPRAPGPED